jgi:hypothetical protein
MLVVLYFCENERCWVRANTSQGGHRLRNKGTVEIARKVGISDICSRRSGAKSVKIHLHGCTLLKVRRPGPFATVLPLFLPEHWLFITYEALCWFWLNLDHTDPQTAKSGFRGRVSRTKILLHHEPALDLTVCRLKAHLSVYHAVPHAVPHAMCRCVLGCALSASVLTPEGMQEQQIGVCLASQQLRLGIMVV